MVEDHTVGRDRREFLRIAGSGVAAFAVAGRAYTATAQTSGSPLKIAMVGAGREGSALGTLFVKAGHPVMLSSRHPEQLKGFVAGLGPLAKAGAVAEQHEARPTVRSGDSDHRQRLASHVGAGLRLFGEQLEGVPRSKIAAVEPHGLITAPGERDVEQRPVAADPVRAAGPRARTNGWVCGWVGATAGTSGVS